MRPVLFHNKRTLPSYHQKTVDHIEELILLLINLNENVSPVVWWLGLLVFTQEAGVRFPAREVKISS